MPLSGFYKGAMTECHITLRKVRGAFGWPKRTGRQLVPKTIQDTTQGQDLRTSIDFNSLRLCQYLYVLDVLGLRYFVKKQHYFKFYYI